MVEEETKRSNVRKANMPTSSDFNDIFDVDTSKLTEAFAHILKIIGDLFPGILQEGKISFVESNSKQRRYDVKTNDGPQMSLTQFVTKAIDGAHETTKSLEDMNDEQLYSYMKDDFATFNRIYGVFEALRFFTEPKNVCVKL